ncbi:MAG TPA: FAD-dependent oxidoreductase, partial [Ktedonobacteraceae bacterium]|nr:FAD-dependent oxidoreductase [Ktedonobacteraceae bacterium]
MGQTTDVAIVGAGVIGCAIAYHLCQTGARVIVLDRAEIAAEASGAAAGLLSPLGNLHRPGAFTDFAMASWSRYSELIPTLEEASGVQVGYARLGSLRTASGAEEVEKLRQRMNTWQAMGWQLSWLTGEEAREREPLLSPDVDAAVHAPLESSILSPNLTRAYAGASRALGATFIEHTQVTAIQVEHSRLQGVYTASGETISCQHLVLAAGAWSADWSEWLGFSIPIAPVRGQMLSLRQPASPL